ncbi:hypothetical protein PAPPERLAPAPP_02650 [Brevundimonas phage vB_BpoS-Papperlapapp]|uniref:Uncharacterized protein n=1 Tax=Brevundimonas phage vB_BpoS-Kabachok TaxID=2948600 RepID=A0A9E7MNZ1_9CAUD|nr:hypothetical protein KABACHOK_01020 [Brevundimonas phage vB_BpoS-Kabachok]USN16006.1 hypothetical protein PAPPERLAPAPP_02650 [Brevundimonas phage vB_BpoS-Papperlapapp]
MGVGYRLSGSTFDRPAAPPPGNPVATNFRLIQQLRVGAFVLVEVQYPDASNYEGRKIMLFQADCFEAVVARNRGVVDPHFSESVDFLSPIARFRPNAAGWAMGLRCAAACSPDA